MKILDLEFFDMIPALPGSEKSKARLASRHDHIMILFDMVQKGKKTVFNKPLH